MPCSWASRPADADGIIQVSTGGAEFLSGLGVKDMAKGAIALADYVRYMAGILRHQRGP